MANNTYYEQPEMWQQYDAIDAISQKTDYIIRHIPPDVVNILDVGCGNGKITNRLKDKWQITGLDISAEALKHVQAPFVQASATEIPFPDNSFDLVISSEMLEHLDTDLLHKAIAEMKRVCKKYLIISVPNAEFLTKNHMKCPGCGTVFHSWQHLQSFSRPDFHKMFAPEFQILNYDAMGEKEQRWIPFLMNIRQKYGHQWFASTGISVCPACGNTKFPHPPGNLLTKVCNGLNLCLAGKKPYWQIGLFRKS